MTTLVIPAYNEGKNLQAVLKTAQKYVDEIIVVDDGSADNTFNVAQQEKGVVALCHLINRGQGAALETGNQKALARGADIIVHFDGDGQFLASEIKEVVFPIKEQRADVVFGSRFLEKKSNLPWFKEKIIIPLAHLVNKLFFGVSLTDPQSGFRALSRSAAQKIKINNDGMAHNSEIMAKVFRHNFKIEEVGITVLYHHFGQNFGQGMKIIKDLFLSKLID
ncbi:glycosyltransferase family 2 protein [Patescibacteria group bacterium]|nr:glycosyltransferase family 2 protein [Patescibacteria group bacterium]